MDTRRDPGQYYPGGKVIPTRPVATGGDVKHSDFEDLDVRTNTLPDLRAAVKGLAARLGATVVTALAVCVAIGATVEKAKLNELDFDADPSVVMNVTFEGLSESSNVYTKAETEAKIVELVPQTETDPVWSAEKSGYATKADLTNKVDKSGVHIGSMFIGFSDEGVYVRNMVTGKGVLLSDDKMARKTATGEVFYYAYPNGSGTFAFASDIPASMSWGAITGKPTTISGYGITDALKSDFTSLTNNAAFTSAVAAVSPPTDTSELEARGFVRIVADDEIYFVTITTAQTEE